MVYNLEKLKHNSLLIGKASTYFSVMKNGQKNKYRFIKFLGKGNLYIGYRKFEKYTYELRERVETLFYSRFDNSTQCAIEICKIHPELIQSNVTGFTNRVIFSSGYTRIGQIRNAKKLLLLLNKIEEPNDCK